MLNHTNVGSEFRKDAFRRVVHEGIHRVAFECEAGQTALQTCCISYVRSEQAWLDKLIAGYHVRQPGIVYGFYQSQDELQAHAIERQDEAPGFIAVSSYCVVALGFFFRAALSHQNILVEFGVPEDELPRSEMLRGPNPFTRPRDAERLKIVKLLTMMAMRFLTAHEMTHILNGHLRYKLGATSTKAIAEARHKLSPRDALVNQILEMDADAGAVVECMPVVIFAERDPKEPARIGCHPVYEKPESALRLWLFAVYGICRVMEDASMDPTPIDVSSHPLPMMRIQMIMGTLFEFLKRERFSRLLDLLPDIIERTISDCENAYAAILDQSLDPRPLQSALNEVNQKRIGAIIREWRNVRPLLEPFARGGRRLAPLPENE